MEFDPDDPAIVDAVAKALIDAEKQRQLEVVGSISFDHSIFETAANMLTDAGARETIIIGWSLVSYCLDFAVRQNLGHGTQKQVAELVEGLGPLSSDAAKLKLTRALGWLQPHIFEAANAVRKWRNKVAHQIVRNEDVEKYNALPQLFREEIDRVVEAVRALAAKTTGYQIKKMPVNDIVLLKCALLLLANHVMGSVIFGPARLALGMTGGPVFFGREESPQWWLDVTKASSRAAIIVIRAGIANSTEEDWQGA